jgi:glycosyltransferase involved in cell wall biosynthesis
MIHSDIENRTNPELSIIIPVFNEEMVISDFLDRLKEVLIQENLDAEIILVDDGSTDQTVQVARQHTIDNLKIVSLSKNYGHMIAIEAGYAQSSGEFVLSMDGDLQHPPSLIPNLLLEIKKPNTDVVIAFRSNRSEDGFIKKFTARFYYRLLRALTGLDLKENAADFRIVSREVVNILLKIQDPKKVYRVLIPSLGFDIKYLSYIADARFAGETKYSLKKMINLAGESILGGSLKPLKLSFWAGGIAMIVSALWSGNILMGQLNGSVVPGWSSLAVAIIFFSGVQLFSIGVLSLYVAKIYIILQDHPKYFIRQIPQQSNPTID